MKEAPQTTNVVVNGQETEIMANGQENIDILGGARTKYEFKLEVQIDTMSAEEHDTPGGQP